MANYPNLAAEKKPTGETSSATRPGWDPFWFMREMLSWTPFRYSPAFNVKETDDAYVYSLVVPKTAVTQAPAAPPPEKTRRTTETDRGSAARTPRRAARSPSRRG